MYQTTEDANPDPTTVYDQTTVDKLQWENLAQLKGWFRRRPRKQSVMRKKIERGIITKECRVTFWSLETDRREKMWGHKEEPALDRR